MVKDHKVEAEKRDAAMSEVAGNPRNNYNLLCAAAARWVATQRGQRVTSDDIYRAVTLYNPGLEPVEKRVMGPVIRYLREHDLIGDPRFTKRGRSHNGDGKDWLVFEKGAW